MEESNEENLINFTLEGFNPKDKRINTLVQVFLKKARELGFNTDTGYGDSAMGEHISWGEGCSSIIMQSY